jgi:hypothetical protein
MLKQLVFDLRVCPDVTIGRTNHAFTYLAPLLKDASFE